MCFGHTHTPASNSSQIRPHLPTLYFSFCRVLSLTSLCCPNILSHRAWPIYRPGATPLIKTVSPSSGSQHLPRVPLLGENFMFTSQRGQPCVNPKAIMASQATKDKSARAGLCFLLQTRLGDNCKLCCQERQRNDSELEEEGNREAPNLISGTEGGAAGRWQPCLLL